MIKVIDLTKSYGGIQILKHCTFEAENRIVGLLGKNGAGKTTLFKLLLGLINADEGSIKISGYDTEENLIEALRLIGATIETPKLYEALTAQENLELHLAYMGFEKSEYESMIANILKQVGLEGANEKLVSTFSLGMKQRLVIARAIIHRPKVLILDEPMNGLDPIGIKAMRELFKTLASDEQMTIIFSSHIIQEVLATCDHILILTDGEFQIDDTVQNLTKRYGDNLQNNLIQLMEGVHYV